MTNSIGPRGEFTLRMTTALSHRLAALAKQEGISLNAWITRTLSNAVAPKKEP